MSDTIQQPAPAAPTKTSPLAAIALGLGALTLVLAVIPVASALAWLPGLAAVVLSIVALAKRHRPTWMAVVGLVLAVVGGIIAVVVTIVSALAVAGTVAQDAIDQAQADATSTVDAVEEPAELAPAGQPVTVGSLTYVIDAVECGLESAGPQYLEQEAAGQFCQVSYSVKNDGDEAATLFAEDVTGQIGASAYEPSSVISTFGEQPLSAQLNPGLETEAVAYIDIPADGALESIRIQPMFDVTAEPVNVAIS